MIRNIKKSNLILGLLVIAFFTVSLSLVLDIQTSTPAVPTQPTIIEIQEHRNVPITHGGDQWPYNCSTCHTEPVYGECTDPSCHPSLDYWVGDNDATYFAHHDSSYTGFTDCVSIDCHGHYPNPNDVRYVETGLVKNNDWHTYCNGCHLGGAHD